MNDDPHGWNHFWDLWQSGQWEPDTAKFMAKHLGPGKLFLDVGAWIGPTTRWAQALDAYVIAVEPDDVALTELTQFACREVEILPCAMTVKYGTYRLMANPKDGGEYGDSMSRIGDEGVAVQGLTLNQILIGRIPDLIKIDVEGYEMELWPEIEPFVADHRIPVHLSVHGETPLMSLPNWDIVANVANDGFGTIEMTP